MRIKNIFFWNQYGNREKTNFLIKKHIVNLAYEKPEVIENKIIKNIRHFKYAYPIIWKKNRNFFDMISKKNKFKKIKLFEYNLINNLFLYNNYFNENTELNINFDIKGFKKDNINKTKIQIPNTIHKKVKEIFLLKNKEPNKEINKKIHKKLKEISFLKNKELNKEMKEKIDNKLKDFHIKHIKYKKIDKDAKAKKFEIAKLKYLQKINNAIQMSENKRIEDDKAIYMFQTKTREDDYNKKKKIEAFFKKKSTDFIYKISDIDKIKDAKDNLRNKKFNFEKDIKFKPKPKVIKKEKKKKIDYDDDQVEPDKYSNINKKRKRFLWKNKIKRSSLRKYAINIDKYNTYIKEYINYYKFFIYSDKKKKVSDWNYELNNSFKYKVNKYFKLPISYITNGSINYKNKNSFLDLKKIKHSKYLHNLNNEFIWKTQNLINDSLLVKKKIIKLYFSKYNNNNFYYKFTNLYIKENPLLLKDFYLNNYIDKKKNKNYFLKKNYFILKITWLWYEYLINKYPNKFCTINNTIIEFEKKILFEKENKEILYINKQTNKIFNLIFPDINNNNIDLKKEYYKRLWKVMQYRFYLFSNNDNYDLNEEIFILKKKIELFESQFLIYKLDNNFIINYYTNYNKHINILNNSKDNYNKKKIYLFNFKNINNKITNYHKFIFNYQDNWIRYSKDNREYWINKSIELLNNKNNIFFFKKNNLILYKFFYKIKYLYINYILYFNIFNHKLKDYLNILYIYIKNFNIKNTNKKLDYKNKILYKITDLEIEFKQLNKKKKYFCYKKKIYSLQIPKIVVSIKIPKIQFYIFNKKINYYLYINKLINYLFTFLKQIINFFSKPIKIKIFTYKYETQILNKSWFYWINKIYYKWRIYKIDVINKPFYFKFFEKYLFEKKYDIYSLFLNKKHIYYFKWFSIDIEKIYIFLNTKLVYYIQHLNYYCLLFFKYISKIMYMSNINYITLIYIQYILHYLLLKINYMFIYIYLILLKLIFFISLYPLIIFFIIYFIYKIYQYKYYIYLAIIYIIDYIKSKYNLLFNNKIINKTYNIQIFNIIFFNKYIKCINNQLLKYINKISKIYTNIKNKFLYYFNYFKNKWK